MSKITDIQWCDSTINPIMGCGGCELFPPPSQVLASIDQAVDGTGAKIDSKRIFKDLVDAAFQSIATPQPGHKNAVNTTNIWHLRHQFLERIRRDHSDTAADAAESAIRKAITCYAATLHLNKGANILKPEYEPKSGYAPIFEAVSTFEGRMQDAAKWQDLLGLENPANPWKAGLPRMIFVSDMGDALSAKRDFPFLKREAVPAFQSEMGKSHLWLWLTKRPGNMAEFAKEIGGFPENVCAMTTLTGPDAESLQRLADLKAVQASIRGLSIEPLWERIPLTKLNLTGIAWVIVGGESGSGEQTRPFALEWAEELRDHCNKHGVAFFLKQLGRNPSRNGEILKLKDKHGGDWDEWDQTLRIREFPKAFHDYRMVELKPSSQLRPVKDSKKTKPPEDPTITPAERVEFTKLDKVVRRGVAAFMECGRALAIIHDGKLWRAGLHKSWEEYCRTVVGMSRGHAHRFLQASQCVLEISQTSPIGDVLPVIESQVRPLLRLAEPSQRIQAWITSVEMAEGKQPTAAQVAKVVFETQHPEGSAEKLPSRAERRVELVSRLKEGVRQKSWPKVEELLAELETLL